MQRSDISQSAKTAHRQAMASTTLNRKYVKRPVKMEKSNVIKSVAQTTDVKVVSNRKISRFGTANLQVASKESEQISPAKPHPTQVTANAKLRERKKQLQREQLHSELTAKELKDQAIKKALAAASKTTKEESAINEVMAKEQRKTEKIHFGFGRVVLALACATAAVFAIVYFVSLNMPDVQFRATAMQLNATYPNYVPYNFSPIEITSEGDTIVLKFKNHTNEENFTIVEENSSWDSNSLLNNFVKKEYGEDYTVIREQGLTIYIGNNKATWVNGGVVYKLTIDKGSLSKKQISSIAVSF